MKKKVLLVCWKNSSNYGTNLQAIALYLVVNKKYPCSILWQRRYVSFPCFLKKSARKIAKCVISFFSKKNNLRKQFDDNISHCFSFMDKVNLNSKNEYKNILKNYETYVVGSDQVWNPNYLDKTYFLDFVPREFRKCAYASSIGVNTIPEKKQKIYRKYLSRFDYLSMREASGARYIQNLLKRQVDTVLDPTLLLSSSEWREYAMDSHFYIHLPPKFILCYFIEEKEIYWETIKKIADLKKMQVIILSINKKMNKKKSPYIIFQDAGPKEFIRFIDQAEFICTDSFHMCAFSINFNKQFGVFRRFNAEDKRGQNSRIDDLFEFFHISNRYLDKQNACADELEYDSINEVLIRERKRSIKKLYSAIGESYDSIC